MARDRHAAGDANNAVLAAVGHNFARLRQLLCALMRIWMLASAGRTDGPRLCPQGA
jgi:hypothetical protein